MNRFPAILALAASFVAQVASASGRPAWVEGAAQAVPSAKVLAVVPATGGDAVWLEGGALQGIRQGMVLGGSRDGSAAEVLVVAVSANRSVALPVAVPSGSSIEPAAVLQVVTR